jgi:hypothetical protein
MNKETVREIELAMLERYAKSVDKNLDVFCNTEDIQQRKYHENTVATRLRVFQKQLNYFQSLFPNDDAIALYGAYYYLYLAKQKAYAVNGWRESQSRSQTWIGGIFTGIMASRKETQEIYDALALLDQSLSMTDLFMTRYEKVRCFLHIRMKKEAFEEVQYLCQNYADVNDENYLIVRELKDLLELGFL